MLAGQLRRVRERGAMLGRDQPRKDLEPAAPDHVVVVAAAECAAAELDHAQPPPLGAVLRDRAARSSDHAVRDALHLQVVLRAVRSSSSRTVQCRPAKNCFSARICRR